MVHKKIHIELKENISLVIKTPQKIPFALYNKLKIELDRIRWKKIMLENQPMSLQIGLSQIALVEKPGGSNMFRYKIFK